jgi:dGTPase
MNPRERYEQWEREMLSENAAKAADSVRDREEIPCTYRTAFQRDRDRILHTKSFRRLKHKTQVFLSPEGDHYRTRLTHTLEVAQIARTIARALRLNEDLTEAIALGHDLGHTPFGHAGERALNDLMKDVGGFRHYDQSVRIVEKLENDGKGLNLTTAVREGIARHTVDPKSVTLEGRIVRLSDRVAYVNHDVDDAIRAGVLQETDIPVSVREHLGQTRQERIDTLITSIVNNSGDDICMDPVIDKYFGELHAFLHRDLYKDSAAKAEEKKVDLLIKPMFQYFVENTDKLPAEYQNTLETEGPLVATCDYIASMTDNYALEVYRGIFIPKGWSVHIE